MKYLAVLLFLVEIIEISPALGVTYEHFPWGLKIKDLSRRIQVVNISQSEDHYKHLPSVKSPILTVELTDFNYVAHEGFLESLGVSLSEIPGAINRLQGEWYPKISFKLAPDSEPDLLLKVFEKIRALEQSPRRPEEEVHPFADETLNTELTQVFLVIRDEMIRRGKYEWWLPQNHGLSPIEGPEKIAEKDRFTPTLINAPGRLDVSPFMSFKDMTVLRGVNRTCYEKTSLVVLARVDETLWQVMDVFVKCRDALKVSFEYWEQTPPAASKETDMRYLSISQWEQFARGVNPYSKEYSFIRGAANILLGTTDNFFIGDAISDFEKQANARCWKAHELLAICSFDGSGVSRNLVRGLWLAATAKTLNPDGLIQSSIVRKKQSEAEINLLFEDFDGNDEPKLQLARLVEATKRVRANEIVAPETLLALTYYYKILLQKFPAGIKLPEQSRADVFYLFDLAEKYLTQQNRASDLLDLQLEVLDFAVLHHESFEGSDPEGTYFLKTIETIQRAFENINQDTPKQIRSTLLRRMAHLLWPQFSRQIALHSRQLAEMLNLAKQKLPTADREEFLNNELYGADDEVTLRGSLGGD